MGLFLVTCRINLLCSDVILTVSESISYVEILGCWVPCITPLFCFSFSVNCYYTIFNPFIVTLLKRINFIEQCNFFSLLVVKHVKKDERKYYEDLLKYSRDHLMLYPYHLSDIMVKGLRVTPFSYYTGIMEVSTKLWQERCFLSWRCCMRGNSM